MFVNPLTRSLLTQCKAFNRVDHQKWLNYITAVILCGYHPHPSFTFLFLEGFWVIIFGVMYFDACVYFILILYVYMHANYFQLNFYKAKFDTTDSPPLSEVFPILNIPTSNGMYAKVFHIRHYSL